MRSIRRIVLLACCFLFFSALSRADCIKDQRSSKTSGLLINEFKITGTRTMSSDELSSITNKLIGSCFNDDREELGEWIGAEFQNRGYFMASVNNVRIKADDPLSVPKPVAVEAEVTEGPRCTLRDIRFTGNHAFSSEKLLSVFPLKKGNLFQRDKIAQAFESVRNLYLAEGYIEIAFVPMDRIVGESVALDIKINEGPQFRMGKLQIFAKEDQADKLRGAWGLSEGAVFDQSYLEKYIKNNQALLPPNFTRDFVEVIRDCKDSTVEVRLPIDQLDPRSQITPKNVDCDRKDEHSR
jgi:outer membrane protein assembly factor BamA